MARRDDGDDVFSSVDRKGKKILFETLADKRPRIAASFPDFYPVDETLYVLYEIEDWFQTLLVIASGGKYEPSARRSAAVRRAILARRGSVRTPFETYFVAVLKALGAPSTEAARVLPGVGLIVARETGNWMTRYGDGGGGREIPPGSLVVTLGSRTAIRSILVYASSSTVYRDAVYEGARRPRTPFVVKFVDRVLAGNSWSRDGPFSIAEAARCPVDYFEKLFEFVWHEEMLSRRPKHRRLLDHAWADSLCISLPIVNLDTGEREFRNVPWKTCCVHSPTESALKIAARSHLRWVLEDYSITTRQQASF